MAKTTDRHFAAARAEAREEALRDADTLTDWLAGECMGKPVSKWQPQLMCAALETMTTANLLSLAMDAGQKPQTRTHALDVILERFVAYPAVAKGIEANAAMRASEIAEQEEADEREAA